jgi:hypothetical protein
VSDLRTDLEAIRKKHHGRLSPRIVLKEARSENHPLHSRFNWDDASAAEAWRLQQAHDLITSVRIGYKPASGEPSSVRYFHAMRAADRNEYEYAPIDELLEDPIRRKLLLRDMERDIDELVARYEHVKEFWAILKRKKPAA